MDIIKSFNELKGDMILKYTENLIKKSREIRKKVILSNNEEYITKQIMDDTYICNMFNMYCWYITLICDNENDRKFWNDVDEVMYEYNYEFNSDVELYKTLSKFNNPFLKKIKDSMEKHGIRNNSSSNKVIDILKSIDVYENKIFDSLNNSVILDIDLEKIDVESDTVLSSIYDTNKKIKINKNTLYFLYKKINDRIVRNNIEKEYIKYVSNSIPYILRLLLLRDAYAKLMNKKNYFLFITNKNDIDSDDIKNLVMDLDGKLDVKLRPELETLKTELNKKYNGLLEYHDIVHYINKLCMNIKFRPSNVISILSFIFEKYFEIKIIKSEKTYIGKYGSSFLLEDRNTKKTLGYLHLDLIKRKTKKINGITFIKLSESYNNNTDSNVCIVANYTDYDKECMTIQDVITLFREFGNIITNTIVNNNMSNDPELHNFTSNIMEFLVLNDEILERLMHDKPKLHIDKIKLERRLDCAFSLKIKCFYAIFDNLIHSSQDFIGLINNVINQNNKQIEINVFNKFYSDTFNKMFSSVSDLLNIKNNLVTPQIISNIISGTHGAIYGNITSVIFSYNAYQRIINEKDGGIIFINEVLKSKKSCKKSIREFIDKLNIDYYANFIENYLGNSELDNDCISSETNCYNEEGSSSPDIDKIIDA